MTSSGPVLALTRQLIQRRSLTPDDAGCQALLGERLKACGFELEWLNHEGVTNLWATLGDGAPLLILAGHTDVVPPGAREHWSSDPFQPEVRDGVLYGRGAADMKSGLAAMATAAERFAGRGAFHGTLALLLTSDEEGYGRHGTKHVAQVLKGRGVIPDYAIVGEATGAQQLGDRIAIGRRGSLGANLKVLGKQGHVAYPHKADNALHRAAAAVAELIAIEWDRGSEHFPPTSFQVSNFHSGTGANNVIPGEAAVVFNFRYAPESQPEDLKRRVAEVLQRHVPRHEIEWWHTGEPFLTRSGKLLEAAQAAIAAVTGLKPELFTGGGTSDARFLSPWGAETIEIGPVNESIHKVNEHVRVDDLERLAAIYGGVLERLLR